MGRIDDRFTFGTLLICLVTFILLIMANTIAVSFRDYLIDKERETILNDSTVSDDIKEELLNDMQNASGMDYHKVLKGIGDIGFGAVYPFPFSLIIAIVQSTLILTMVYCMLCMIRAYLPLI